MGLGEIMRRAVDVLRPAKSGLEQLKESQDEAEGVYDVTLPRGRGWMTYHYGRNPMDIIPRDRPVLRTKHRERLRTSIPDRPCDTEGLPRENPLPTHIAISVGKNRVWELCRLLKNPKRLDLLVQIYRDCKDPRLDGVSVNDMVDDGLLNQAATSEYLKQLEGIGLIRRQRVGKSVRYFPDYSSAEDAIRDFASLLRGRLQTERYGLDFIKYMPALSNAFRASAVNVIAENGRMSVEMLCDLFKRPPRFLFRDLKPAVVDTLLGTDDSENPTVYWFQPPSDAIAQRLVELAG